MKRSLAERNEIVTVVRSRTSVVAWVTKKGVVIFDPNETKLTVLVGADLYFFDLERGRIFGFFPFRKNFCKFAPAQENIISHLSAASHPHAQNIFPMQFVKFVDCLIADHAAIGHNANFLYAEAVLQSLCHRNKRRNIGGIAGKNLRTNRISFAVQNNGYNELLEIRAMIFRVAILSKIYSALTLKIQ